MSRHRTITYSIDEDTGLVFSKVNGEWAIPMLDFAGMKPENNFETKYFLEKVPHVTGCRLIHTRLIPTTLKNKHRAFWGMKPIATKSKCPECDRNTKYTRNGKCLCGYKPGETTS